MTFMLFRLRMRFGIAVLLLVGMSSEIVGHSVFAAPKSTTIPRFDAAVQSGVEFLKNAVKPGGDPSLSVLAAYALFKAGEPVDSPLVKRGLEIASAPVRADGSHPNLAYISGYDNHVYEFGLFAMFLTDVDPERYKPSIQVIADYVTARQRDDGSWTGNVPRGYDTSMSQYAMLALWAAHRAGCSIKPETLDRAASWHLKNRMADGGWTYCPSVIDPPGSGKLVSTRNMTMAAVSSISIAHLLLHGPPGKTPDSEPKRKFGVLQKETPSVAELSGSAFRGYRPKNDAAILRTGIDWGLSYETANFNPVNIHGHFPIYFYYTAERALSISGTSKVAGKEWYTTYGDGLLTLQRQNGSWMEISKNDEIAGTSFAILYYMRSTQQILDKMYGPDLQRGNRGNPLGEKRKKEETKSLDTLLSSLEAVDLNSPDLNNAPDIADELIRSVQSIKDREQLIGQVDRLKTLVRHPDPDVRQPVYWALGRTSDLSLVPLLLKGLRDPNVDVNVEAEHALRYIARKPQGLGLSDNPVAGAEKATDAERLKLANQWRDRAVREWAGWYREVCSFEESASINELELLNPSAGDGQ